jgi:DNA-binding GntR family transcriptional regulator
MSQEPVNGERLAASEKIAAFLRDEILEGHIKPGEWIRQEEVGARLGASRVPVREALRMLELEGLTEILVNRGARVPLLDMHEVEVLYRMRERLEPLALAESIDVLTAEQHRRLEEIQDRIEVNSDVAEFLALDREFHLLTYAGCQIDQLNASITRLWNCTQHYRRSFMNVIGPSRRWVVNAEHRLILDAIERRDAEDAERYLSGHVRRTRVELMGHPEIFEP